MPKAALREADAAIAQTARYPEPRQSSVLAVRKAGARERDARHSTISSGREVRGGIAEPVRVLAVEHQDPAGSLRVVDHEGEQDRGERARRRRARRSRIAVLRVRTTDSTTGSSTKKMKAYCRIWVSASIAYVARNALSVAANMNT